MKVAAYIRVSTAMQVEDGYSLAAQRERLKAFAFSQGWEIVEFYVDEGISAKDMERPALQRMLKGVQEKQFDIVLVYKLDRLTRSVTDLDRMLKEFNKYDVMFKSSTEVYDTTTATGRLFIRLVASMAQWERENLGERVRMGMEQKALDGKWVINVPPFGYERKGDYLQIIEQEAVIVREIYQLYLTGQYGVGKVAKVLNDKNYKTKTGASWSFNNVHYVLTNPIYIGTMRYNYRMNKEQYFEVENATPAIVTATEFHAVQKILNSRTNSHPKKATSPYIFTSVLRCSRCGGSMNGHQAQTKRNGKKYISYSYFCVNKRFKDCDLPSISQNYLESQFLKLVDAWTVDKQVVAEVAASSTESEKDKSSRVKTIYSELDALESRRTKWQYGWANGMLKDEDLKKRNEEEDKKEEMLLNELKTIQGVMNQENNDTLLLEALTSLKSTWNQLSVHEKKQFVNITVKSMVVDKTEKRQHPESVKITDVVFN
jgi:site-specific DNA recombinase